MGPPDMGDPVRGQVAAIVDEAGHSYLRRGQARGTECSTDLCLSGKLSLWRREDLGLTHST